MTSLIDLMDKTSSPLKSGTSQVESPNFTFPTTPNKSDTYKDSSLTSLSLMNSHQMKLSQNLLSVQQLETDRLYAHLPHSKDYQG